MALTADKAKVTRLNRAYNDPVLAGAKIYAGALVVLDAAGWARPGIVATTLKARGVAVASVDNTLGANGALSVDTEPGLFRFKNSASGDLIARADIRTDCYIVDDETVAKTSGGSTRSIAGKVIDVEADGVWVQIG
ncbi:MAG: hypothetical protein ACT4QA_23130 [Panacagrimonas sp.]